MATENTPPQPGQPRPHATFPCEHVAGGHAAISVRLLLTPTQDEGATVTARAYLDACVACAAVFANTTQMDVTRMDQVFYRPA